MERIEPVALLSGADDAVLEPMEAFRRAGFAVTRCETVGAMVERLTASEAPAALLVDTAACFLDTDFLEAYERFLQSYGGLRKSRRARTELVVALSKRRPPQQFMGMGRLAHAYVWYPHDPSSLKAICERLFAIVGCPDDGGDEVPSPDADLLSVCRLLLARRCRRSMATTWASRRFRQTCTSQELFGIAALEEYVLGRLIDDDWTPGDEFREELADLVERLEMAQRGLVRMP